MTSVGAAAGLLPAMPAFSREISVEEALTTVDVKLKKRMADVALNAAKGKGATYTDVRIGRYLRQVVATRESRVDNIANGESYGIGIRVIAAGSWGFAATDKLDDANIAKTAELAVAIAKGNSKIMTEPVKLAPQKGYGEVNWKTPIEVNGFSVPIAEKVELLLGVNAAAMQAGAKYVNSNMFLVNEQKYFASSDGSYIDRIFTGSGQHLP